MWAANNGVAVRAWCWVVKVQATGSCHCCSWYCVALLWQVLHRGRKHGVLIEAGSLCVGTFVQDYYELGVILTRKKLYTQATKNLEKAKKLWDGEESDLAQVCDHKSAAAGA